MTRDLLEAQVIGLLDALRARHGIDGRAVDAAMRLRDLGLESLHLVEFLLDLTDLVPEQVVERLVVDEATSVGGLAAQLHDLLHAAPAAGNAA